MRFLDRSYLVFDDLKTVTPAEVVGSAARLGLTFPDGYLEYMAELDEGVLSDQIRIWSPRRVEDELREHRRFWSDNFCWDADGPLTPARTRETVLLGDTIDGHNLVFLPDRPDDLFVLPRHEDQSQSSIDWLARGWRSQRKIKMKSKISKRIKSKRTRKSETSFAGLPLWS